MREPLAQRCYPKVVEQRGSGGMRRVRGVRPEAVEDVEGPPLVLKGDLATVGRGAKTTCTLRKAQTPHSRFDGMARTRLIARLTRAAAYNVP